MLGIHAMSEDECKSSVVGLGPRRRLSRSLKAACSQVRNLRIVQDSFNLPYIAWLDNAVGSSEQSFSLLTYSQYFLAGVTIQAGYFPFRTEKYISGCFYNAAKLTFYNTW